MLVHCNVLSAEPLSVIPPPFAVTSVAPVAENVIDPIVFVVVEVIVICVAESTLVTVVAPPKAPVPDILVKAIPGINPVVDAIPVTVVVVVVAEIVPVVDAIAITDPISIFLSSTTNVFVFNVVVVPFIVKSPPIVNAPVIVIAEVSKRPVLGVYFSLEEVTFAEVIVPDVLTVNNGYNAVAVVVSFVIDTAASPQEVFDPSVLRNLFALLVCVGKIEFNPAKDKILPDESQRIGLVALRICGPVAPVGPVIVVAIIDQVVPSHLRDISPVVYISPTVGLFGKSTAVTY